MRILADLGLFVDPRLSIDPRYPADLRIPEDYGILVDFASFSGRCVPKDTGIIPNPAITLVR